MVDDLIHWAVSDVLLAPLISLGPGSGYGDGWMGDGWIRAGGSSGDGGGDGGLPNGGRA